MRHPPRSRDGESSLALLLGGTHASFSVGSAASPVALEALLDPLSRAAQTIAPLLMFFAQRLDAQVRVERSA
jgi:hypothetical protein